MKLLIITQKVDKDDPDLGFFLSWISEFAKHFELVSVICLEKGAYDLPENVRVFSLGKEERQSRLQYLIHFYWFIIHERKKYDTVFVHMNQIYVVLGGLLWRMWRKKIMLWYTHRAVDWTLRVAAILSQDIFTASKQSFNVPTKKLHVVGHGINISRFEKQQDIPHAGLALVSVARITRIKNLETLVEAVSILAKKNIEVSCTIVGPQITPDDTLYFNELQKLVREKGLERRVVFAGGITNEKLPEYFWRSDININLAPTGGVDTVILEGIVGGALPLASNASFVPVFGRYEKDLMFNLRDPEDLAGKIEILSRRGDKIEILGYLADRVRSDFGLEKFIIKIVDVCRKP